MLRVLLDRLYLYAGYAAGLFMLAIFVLMMALSAGRPIGMNIPAADDFVSSCMAAMAFLGRRLIRWVVLILSEQGVKEFYIVAHGKENRYQTKVLLRYGEELGIDVRYSPVKYDALSTGSADSAQIGRAHV